MVSSRLYSLAGNLKARSWKTETVQKGRSMGEEPEMKVEERDGRITANFPTMERSTLQFPAETHSLGQPEARGMSSFSALPGLFLHGASVLPSVRFLYVALAVLELAL